MNKAINLKANQALNSLVGNDISHSTSNELVDRVGEAEPSRIH